VCVCVYGVNVPLSRLGVWVRLRGCAKIQDWVEKNALGGSRSGDLGGFLLGMQKLCVINGEVEK
jgi:hypothetical protein